MHVSSVVKVRPVRFGGYPCHHQDSTFHKTDTDPILVLSPDLILVLSPDLILFLCIRYTRAKTGILEKIAELDTDSESNRIRNSPTPSCSGCTNDQLTAMVRHLQMCMWCMSSSQMLAGNDPQGGSPQINPQIRQFDMTQN
eukprot:CAMPEP_0195269994 /NCGR_PEP_ID=MMETSP0706-20130129/14090_2 /TAXON_ID=33640 /ORGANISM="Asterionellopsis glacialis, Strain CCMP134" /LENGTH=140 /DNA_ID=CAMNT_0040325189 /DNA_START=568 /DNA_END=990 /DNA_ORIENTATION=-